MHSKLNIFGEGFADNDQQEEQPQQQGEAPAEPGQ